MLRSMVLAMPVWQHLGWDLLPWAATSHSWGSRGWIQGSRSPSFLPDWANGGQRTLWHWGKPCAANSGSTVLSREAVYSRDNAERIFPLMPAYFGRLKLCLLIDHLFLWNASFLFPLGITGFFSISNKIKEVVYSISSAFTCLKANKTQSLTVKGAFSKAGQGSNFCFKKPDKFYDAILHGSRVSGEKKKSTQSKPECIFIAARFLEWDYRSSANVGNLQKHTPPPHASISNCHMLLKDKSITPREAGLALFLGEFLLLQHHKDVLLSNCLYLWFLPLACDAAGASPLCYCCVPSLLVLEAFWVVNILQSDVRLHHLG